MIKIKGASMKNLLKYALFILCIHFSASKAFAGTETVSGVTPRSTDTGVMYVNGGIGNEEQEALKAMRKEYNLQLTFATKGSGEYMSNIHLSIENKSGMTLFNSKGIGPLFLIQLTPGTYQVTAKSRDMIQTKTVSVGNSGIKDLFFYW
jgi:hypothetical protein